MAGKKRDAVSPAPAEGEESAAVFSFPSGKRGPGRPKKEPAPGADAASATSPGRPKKVPAPAASEEGSTGKSEKEEKAATPKKKGTEKAATPKKEKAEPPQEEEGKKKGGEAAEPRSGKHKGVKRGNQDLSGEGEKPTPKKKQKKQASGEAEKPTPKKKQQQTSTRAEKATPTKKQQAPGAAEKGTPSKGKAAPTPTPTKKQQAPGGAAKATPSKGKQNGVKAEPQKEAKSAKKGPVKAEKATMIKKQQASGRAEKDTPSKRKRDDSKSPKEAKSGKSGTPAKKQKGKAAVAAEPGTCSFLMSRVRLLMRDEDANIRPTSETVSLISKASGRFAVAHKVYPKEAEEEESPSAFTTVKTVDAQDTTKEQGPDLCAPTPVQITYMEIMAADIDSVLGTQQQIESYIYKNFQQSLFSVMSSRRKKPYDDIHIILPPWKQEQEST